MCPMHRCEVTTGALVTLRYAFHWTATWHYATRQILVPSWTWFPWNAALAICCGFIASLLMRPSVWFGTILYLSLLAASGKFLSPDLLFFSQSQSPLGTFYVLLDHTIPPLLTRSRKFPIADHYVTLCFKMYCNCVLCMCVCRGGKGCTWGKTYCGDMCVCVCVCVCV
jgi:hypothetical protein